MTDLFSDDQTTEHSDKNTPNQGSVAGDTLAELVGEGKKFKTVEDLAKSKVQADQFIEQLKTESAEMRRRLTELEASAGKSRTIEDVLNAVKGAQEEGGNQSAISTEDILKAIDRRVSELDIAKARKANAEIAQAELLSRFKGDTEKAQEYIRKEAARVGLKPSELKGLSETSPEAFKRILGLTNQPNVSGASFRSEVNSEATSGSLGVRNSAYYADLKKQLGARFWDPKIQQQRFKDRQSLGTKFYE